VRGGQSSNRVFLEQPSVLGQPRESSEITSYDNDGYLVGQRLALSPKRVVDCTK
jgi:hypothetical protein